ncbi:MAG: acyl-homoserine-lactone synthase [Pseudomonadota bacterium]
MVAEKAWEVQAFLRLRRAVYTERLGWAAASGPVEIDHYDSLGPTYVVYEDESGGIICGARLLPTTGPTMVGGPFRAAFDEAPPASPLIWESSRYCVSPALSDPHVVREVSAELFAAGIEWMVRNGVAEVVTFAEPAVIRMIGSMGAPARLRTRIYRDLSSPGMAAIIPLSEQVVGDLRSFARRERGARQPTRARRARRENGFRNGEIEAPIAAAGSAA